MKAGSTADEESDGGEKGEGAPYSTSERAAGERAWRRCVARKKRLRRGAKPARGREKRAASVGVVGAGRRRHGEVVIMEERWRDRLGGLVETALIDEDPYRIP